MNREQGMNWLSKPAKNRLLDVGAAVVSSAAAPTRVATWLLWVLTAVLAVSAALLHVRLISDLDRVGQNLLSEAEMLYGLRSVRTGETLYHDFSTPPHVFTQYTPLFYLVPGTIARWLDAGTMETYIVGRGYVYLAWLGVALAVYGLARQAGCAGHLSLLGALLWLAGGLAMDWSNSYRPDSIALFCSLAAVWLCQRGRRPAYAAGTIGLLVVAFLHKQSSVIALFVILIEELRQRRPGRAAVLLGGWCAAVAVAIGVAQSLTNGIFAKNVFSSLAVFSDIRQPLYILLAALIAEAAVFSGATLACATIPEHRCPRTLKLYFGLAFVFALLTSEKARAAVNYYLEPFALACVLSAVMMMDDWQAPWRRRTDMLVRVGWLVWVLAFSVATLLPRALRFPQLVRDVAQHRMVRRREADAWERISSRIAALGQPVLIEHPYLALRQESPPFMMNPGMFTAMQWNGKFDDADLLQRIEHAQFKGIVATRFPLDAEVYDRDFSPRWIEPMRRRYALAEVVRLELRDTNFYIYVPQTGSVAATRINSAGNNQKPDTSNR